MDCIAKLRPLDISLSGAEYHFRNYMQDSGLTYTGGRTMVVNVNKMVCTFGPL